MSRPSSVRRLVLAAMLVAAVLSARAIVVQVGLLLEADHTAGWGYATLQPAAEAVARIVPAGDEVLVLAPTMPPAVWLRYLDYPRRYRIVPTGAHADFLAGALAPGESWLLSTLVGSSPPADEIGRRLAGKLGAREVALVWEGAPGVALFRVQR